MAFALCVSGTQTFVDHERSRGLSHLHTNFTIRLKFISLQCFYCKQQDNANVFVLCG